MFDVIVVGAGPGGSMAAKKCADYGMKVLVLERRKLPRDKNCSGLIMKPWCENIIREEFGEEIPRRVLASPYWLKGYMLHLPGIEPQKVEVRQGYSRRRDLDYWLSQKAKDNGAEIWEKAKVIGVSQSDGGCRVQLIKAKERQELKSRFVIGADGANSIVRKSIFPRLRLRLVPSFREEFKGQVDIDKDYYHWFHPTGQFRPRFQCNNKGDGVFMLESTVKRAKWPDMTRTLLDYGFDPTQEPFCKFGCLHPLFYTELISGSFVPVKGNIFLVGDAAGLLSHLGPDGIGAAMKSGISAVTSVIKACRTGKSAAEIYLQELEPIIAKLKMVVAQVKRIEERARCGGPKEVSEALRQGWEESQNADLT